MRTLRVVVPAVTAMAFVLSAAPAAFAAPSTPSSAPAHPAYAHGKFLSTMSADCHSMTTEAKWWNDNFTLDVALQGKSGKIYWSESRLPGGNGTATVEVAAGDTPVTSYTAVVDPSTGVHVQEIYGPVTCGTAEQTKNAPWLGYAVSSTCAPAGANGEIVITASNWSQASRPVTAWVSASYQGAPVQGSPTATWPPADRTEVTRQVGANATDTFRFSVPAGTYEAVARVSGPDQIQRQVVTVPACSANPASRTPAQQAPAAEPAASQPNLANTGGQA